MRIYKPKKTPQNIVIKKKSYFFFFFLVSTSCVLGCETTEVCLAEICVQRYKSVQRNAVGSTVCPLPVVGCTVFCVERALYNWECTLHSMKYLMYNIQRTGCSVPYIFYSVQYTVLSLQCALTVTDRGASGW